jgi:hypothetical protein
MHAGLGPTTGQRAGPVGFGLPLVQVPQAGEERAAGIRAYQVRNAALPTPPSLSDAPSLLPHGPNPGLLPALTVSVRQSVTHLLPMRWGLPAGGLSGGAGSTRETVVAFLTAGGEIGCFQPISRDVAVRLDSLERHLGNGRSEGGEVLVAPRQATMPPRASAHLHSDSWCPYTLSSPYAEISLWQGQQRRGLVCWSGTATELEAQQFPVDGAIMEACCRLLDRCFGWGAGGSCAGGRGSRPVAAARVQRLFAALPGEQKSALWALHELGMLQSHRVLGETAGEAGD